VSIGATGGLRPPLLYWCADVRWRNTDFCDAQTHIRPRAAGVSPPWSGEPGAGRSKSCSVRRRPERQPRAAGVSPPWVDKPASAETGAIRRQTIEGVCADCRCIRVYKRHGANVAPESFMGHTGPDYNRVHWRHGGLTPPALVLVCGRPPAKQRFLRCTNAHSTKSGGRQPAVSIGIASAVVFVCHGLLTPAAPGCTTFVCCEMRDSQCGVVHTTGAADVSPPCQRSVLANRKGISATVSALATRLRKGTRARW
jgi:hypothetical protein